MTTLHLLPSAGHQTAATLKQYALALFDEAQSLRRPPAHAQVMFAYLRAWKDGAASQSDRNPRRNWQSLRCPARGRPGQSVHR